jgi:hypothetical protein
LSLSSIEQLDVPTYSEQFESTAEALYKKSVQLKNDSGTAYKQADSLLFNALNLTTYTPDTKNTNIKSLKESFGACGRLDAEHYQPKFDEIEKLIKINSEYFKRVEEIQTYNARGLQPEYVENGPLDVINSKHILEDHLDYDNFEKTSSVFWDQQAKAQVFKDDILVYTTGANIGRINIYQSGKKALASNHVNIIRITGEDPYYVSFVMNSLIGRMQTDKLSAGSAQAELYPKDIAQFIIPFIDKAIQKKIREKIISSLTLKKQSATLLEAAKHAVEIAIEQDEAAGLAYIVAYA